MIGKQFDLLLKMRDRLEPKIEQNHFFAIRETRRTTSILEKRLGSADPEKPLVLGFRRFAQKMGAIERADPGHGKSTEDFANLSGEKTDGNSRICRISRQRRITAPTRAELASSAELDQRLERNSSKWREVLAKYLPAIERRPCRNTNVRSSRLPRRSKTN